MAQVHNLPSGKLPQLVAVSFSLLISAIPAGVLSLSFSLLYGPLKGLLISLTLPAFLIVDHLYKQSYKNKPSLISSVFYCLFPNWTYFNELKFQEQSREYIDISEVYEIHNLALKIYTFMLKGNIKKITIEELRTIIEKDTFPELSLSISFYHTSNRLEYLLEYLTIYSHEILTTTKGSIFINPELVNTAYKEDYVQ